MAEETDPKTTKAASTADSEDGEVEQSQDDLLARYRWYKCKADPAAYGTESEVVYYLHADTQTSQWHEPSEPYWIYNVETGSADTDAGLQHPTSDAPSETAEAEQQQQAPAEAASKSKEPEEEYTGYNPKIHGDYDPNADYAQYHKRKREEEAAATFDPFATSQAPIPGAATYESVMATNRFTGNAQVGDLGPERHSDQAKSGRQMNAFFDVDAAANAHDGRSLKEERKSKKLSKEEVKAFNKQRQDKKKKKRMQFYTS